MLRPGRVLAAGQAVPPALMRTEVVDQDPAEPALADRVRGGPGRLVDVRRGVEDPPGRPAVVLEEEADVVEVHGAGP